LREKKKAPAPTGPATLPDFQTIQAAIDAAKNMLMQAKGELEQFNDDDRSRFNKLFGTPSEKARDKILKRVNKEITLLDNLKSTNFKPVPHSESGQFAYTYPHDASHTIYLDEAFNKAPLTGDDSKAGTLIHELSHFNDIAGTVDHWYGEDRSLHDAWNQSSAAMSNADSFEYYVEGAK
jgi:hypothetical protein